MLLVVCNLASQQGQTGVSIFTNHDVLSLVSVSSQTSLNEETLRTRISSVRQDAFRQKRRSARTVFVSWLAGLFVTDFVLVDGLWYMVFSFVIGDKLLYVLAYLINRKFLANPSRSYNQFKNTLI